LGLATEAYLAIKIINLSKKSRGEKGGASANARMWGQSVAHIPVVEGKRKPRPAVKDCSRSPSVA